MSHNSKEELVYRTCVLLVQHFRNLIKARAGGFNCGFHSRIFQHMLHWEFDFVGVGQSAEVTNESGFHPEHVVPCAVLIRETLRLIEENVLSDTEIAKLLQKHWKIARITKEQASEIDKHYKSEMPPGWCFESGETLARLAHIKLVPISK
ncbi:MAG: hypothetical protein M0R47_06065 [Methylobacter sp.]|jgi:hypothetical protein|uniref:hypothetical protein n=1 Tax=Methylobacter sp. TaxID=2051955 RepID=UPI0025EBB3D7|nr:hypothetical protein [Methylobacter sp.]MCK9620086.1 hypothetical protein [Methylobacter sp.]